MSRRRVAFGAVGVAVVLAAAPPVAAAQGERREERSPRS